MTLLENNISRFNTSISRSKTSCSILNKSNMMYGAGAYTTFGKNGEIDVFLPLLLQNSYAKNSNKPAVDARAIWGTNFHELAHILYSEHRKNSLNGIVRKYDPMVLEENRVEFLYMCEFPGNEKWLEYGVLKATDNFNIDNNIYHSNDLNSVLQVYLLFSARTWIRDIHKGLRSQLVKLWGVSNVEKLDDLILDFCVLKKSELGNAKCKKIMRDIEDLLPNNFHQYQQDASCPLGHASPSDCPSSDYDDSSAVEIAKDMIGSESDDAEDEGENGGSSGKNNSKNKKSDKKESGGSSEQDVEEDDDKSGESSCGNGSEEDDKDPDGSSGGNSGEEDETSDGNESSSNDSSDDNEDADNEGSSDTKDGGESGDEQDGVTQDGGESRDEQDGDPQDDGEKEANLDTKNNSQSQNRGNSLGIDEDFMDKQQRDADIDVKNSDGTPSSSAGYYFNTTPSIFNATVDQDIVNKKRIMERELERMNDEAQSGYLHGLPSGSVDMNVAFNPYRDVDRMFYEWSPGVEDAVSIELVILVDCSSSMGDQTQKVMESVYPIISAFHDFEGISNINVFAFNESCHTIYNDKQEISPIQVAYPQSTGGTDPTQSLNRAIEIFKNSLIERKVLLVFTDGEWFGDVYNYQRIMRTIKSYNVSTGYMMYGTSYNETYKLFDYHVTSNDIDDFGKMANVIVMESMKNDIYL